MDHQPQIDDIVSMLDHFVSTGGGHANIKIEDPSSIGNLKIDTYQSSDCSMTTQACSVPTLTECIDDERFLKENED